MDELILSKRALVTRAVKSYLGRYPSLTNLKADLTSAGMLGLVKAFRRNPDADDAYLTKTIQREIAATGNLLSDAIHAPRTTKQRRAKLGKAVAPTFVDRMPADVIDQRGSNLLTKILECRSSDTERQIVRDLASGYTQREIATRLSIDARRVSEIVKVIKQRYENDESGTDEPTIRIKPSTNCRCGSPIERRYDAGGRCEDCFANDQQKYNGDSQRVGIAA